VDERAIIAERLRDLARGWRPTVQRVIEVILGETPRRANLSIDLNVTETTVFRWEQQVYAIDDERKIELARCFGVTVADLMAWPKDVR
jgi:hypothetical protein